MIMSDVCFKQQLSWQDFTGKGVGVCSEITHRQMGENDYDEPWTELNFEVQFIFIKYLLILLFAYLFIYF